MGKQSMKEEAMVPTIEEQHREALDELIESFKEKFTGLGYVLVVFSPEKGGDMSFITNTDMEGMVEVFEDVIAEVESDNNPTSVLH